MSFPALVGVTSGRRSLTAPRPDSCISPARSEAAIPSPVILTSSSLLQRSAKAKEAACRWQPHRLAVVAAVVGVVPVAAADAVELEVVLHPD